MKNKGAEKVKLTSYDDLFGIADPALGESITSVPLSQLHPFKNHPFQVTDDVKMQETVESVKRYGILMPGIVRPYLGGGYEVVAGHRRWRACELAGLDEMPVIIRDLDDDTATVIMVDTNIQREDILPSEKARAYQMKYKAMKHQGSKGEKHTADEVGEAAKESGRTVQRYIRLTELVDELLDYVDENKISLTVGEKLSYLSKEQQMWVSDSIAKSGLFPSKLQAEQLKAGSDCQELTQSRVYAILIKKENKTVNVTIPAKKINSYFPKDYTRDQIEEVIYALLEEWKENEGREE